MASLLYVMPMLGGHWIHDEQRSRHAAIRLESVNLQLNPVLDGDDSLPPLEGAEKQGASLVSRRVRSSPTNQHTKPTVTHPP